MTQKNIPFRQREEATVASLSQRRLLRSVCAHVADGLLILGIILVLLAALAVVPVVR